MIDGVPRIHAQYSSVKPTLILNNSHFDNIARKNICKINIVHEKIFIEQSLLS